MKGKAVIRLPRAASLVLVLATSMAAAQDFDAGLVAYGSGDFATALRELTPLAEQGDAKAQFFLGNMYSIGQGVPQDHAEAVKWFRLAAEQGLAEAQNNLGVSYTVGKGVPQDDITAHMWFNLAAANGLPADSSGRDRVAARRGRVAAKLATADITEAQRRAKTCLASAYKNCD